jgi:transcriptional regulator with XRE-family HTH domain
VIEPIYASLGATIRALRRNRGLSQKAVAEILGIPRVSLTMIENGNQRLQVHQLLILAEIFETSVEALLSERFEERQCVTRNGENINIYSCTSNETLLYCNENGQ